MMLRRHRFFALTVLLSLLCMPLAGPRSQAADKLPTELSDRSFWQMIADFSEPGGVFRSDNLVSNETTYQEVIPDLAKRSSPDGAYIGVGPDQNFTYIAALRPRIAFIIDIRRQNLVQHLLFKALVEMSNDRADFLSRLFSRPRPAGLGRSAAPAVLFDAYSRVPATETLYRKNLKEVEDRLVKRHGFPLTADDLRSLEYVYSAFYSEGPDLRYSFPRMSVGANWFPTYAQLMVATDLTGLNHSYMANEENFRVLREFERHNLLIPIVGDFAGGKAIRAVGRYLMEHGATANYVYTSNVEQYLFQSDAWEHYYANIAALPLNDHSTFIRSYFDSGFVFPPGIITRDLHSVQLLDPIFGLLNAVRAHEVRTYNDLVGRSR